MEADNQNNWNAVRRSLDELSEIPGESAFNSNAAWNKLNQRLANKQIHRKPAFYWVAAATLLLLLTAGWFMLDKPSQSNLAKNAITMKPSNKQVDSNPVLITSTPGAQKKFIVAVQEAKMEVKKQSIRRKANPHTFSTDSSSLTLLNKLPAAVTEVASDTTTPDTIMLVQSAPIKKLKVIHNNQLNSVIYKPELSISNVPTSNFPSSGHIRFSRNSSDNILQIKLSLTN